MTPPLLDVLRSLTQARFDEVAAVAGARDYITPQAPPVRRSRELFDWAKETTEQERRLREVLEAELRAWPDEVLTRWRAWATLRLGEMPILGFQGTMRMPVHLDDAFVPLALAYHAHELERREDIAQWTGWNLTRAIADAEGEKRGTLRSLALIGLPGSGKTTLLKHAWGVAADRGSDALGFPPGLTPVFLRVAWCDPARRAHELLPEALRRWLDGEGYAAAVEPLLSRPLLWLLDGVDEAGSLDHRTKLAERLVAAMDHRPDDRFLVTGRTAGWREVEGIVRGRLRMWEVQPLKKEQVPAFIRRWHDCVLPKLAGAGRSSAEIAAEAERSAEDLARRLLSSEWLADSRRDRMVRNPLLLSVLCLVNRQDGRLPERRSKLYERALHTMFEQLRRVDAFGHMADGARHVGLPMDESLRMFAAVAWHAHAGGREDDVRELTTDEALAWMKPVADTLHWPEPTLDLRDVLRRAEEDCGLLQATTAETWQFSHLTFQEHLAARHAAAAGLARELAARAGEERWEEPIRLAMSTERLPRELLGLILSDPKAPWERPRFVRLMADCAREADPTPFADALARCADALEAGGWPLVDAWVRAWTGRMSRADAESHAVRVLALFAGRALPPKLEVVVLRLAERPGAAGDAARGLIGRAVAPPAEGADPVPGSVWVVTLPGGARMPFVWVPGGEFWMGASKEPGARNFDAEAYEDESPVRRVRLTTGFWLGQHPVTNAQYRAFVTATGAPEPESWGRDGFDGDEQPVTGVDWSNAARCCGWVGEQVKRRGVLPTEAQWERAARGDDARRFPWGNDDPTPAHAVFDGAPLAPVGGRPAGAGPSGAHDLAGNVWEWCRDGWRDRHPDVSGVDIDPCHEVPDAAPRVARGGSWDDWAWNLHAAGRLGGLPGYRLDFLGFRVCLLRENVL